MHPARVLIPLMIAALLTGCTATAVPKEFTAEVLPAPSPDLPLLDVFVLEDDTIATMDIESYVACVVAGEMPSDWPLEALKAQAILARTFVLKFITEKASRYPGADISTDIAEAQAYDASAVNDHIREAVRETEGLILIADDGTLPYTWFHAHSGGRTAPAKEGIDWQGREPAYTRSTEGLDSDDAPASAKAWSASFPAEEFLAACRDAGASITTCEQVTIGQTGESGRAVTLLVDGTPVNAARLRIALGSTKMRSTLLTDAKATDGHITLSGRGYGHGVGMPQWGAYGMAQDGYTGTEIALHYYKGLSVQKAWGSATPLKPAP